MKITYIHVFIQYRVRLVLIYMRVALFKIRLIRKSVLKCGSSSYAPVTVELPLFVFSSARFTII